MYCISILRTMKSSVSENWKAASVCGLYKSLKIGNLFLSINSLVFEQIRFSNIDRILKGAQLMKLSFIWLCLYTN